MKSLGFASKLMPIFKSLVDEIAKLSFMAFIAMICIGGVLLLIGNEHGARKLIKNAVYGFVVIQIANMLL